MQASSDRRPIGSRYWESSAPINREVVEQHASEAAFLWTQRDHAVLAPHYSLKNVAALDERVEANVDGLRIAGPVGWEIAAAALAEDGPGEVFAASIVAFESDHPARTAQVLDVGCGTPESARALISALGWSAFEQVRPCLEKLLAYDKPEVQRTAIAGFTAHRQHPGSAVAKAIADPDPRLRARALKAVGELGDLTLLDAVYSGTSDNDEACRFFAAWSAVRLGSHTTSILTLLRQITEEGGYYAPRALDIALRCMRLSEANDWLIELRKSPERLRLALVGAGVVGDPDCVEDLIALMEDKAIGRVAGEAFSMITGADLGYEDLDGDAPKTFPQSPSDDPNEEDVDQDPDGDLPWPLRERVSSWWQKKKDRYLPGVRYLQGNKITVESLTETLTKGTQRQRAAAALELGLRSPFQPLFEIRARGHNQLRSINGMSCVKASGFRFGSTLSSEPQRGTSRSWV